MSDNEEKQKSDRKTAKKKALPKKKNIANKGNMTLAGGQDYTAIPTVVTCPTATCP